MPRRVFFSPAALHDIAEIRAWNTLPGAGIVAKRRVMAILAAIRSLADAALRGRLLDDGSDADCRLMVIDRHSVVYRVKNDADGDVDVIRIWSPGRDRG
ncbi:type II toxin-antitoxin system RelE/ParE family toxin [Niveispirillum sp. KHB5.9]|uniref:type II toxin-antitoxin system RelE/ParE family toxin n=1 Tax=Niveispirillum sp. KHB5.9 TaxID=3400269 RepID=UPI003A897E39